MAIDYNYLPSSGSTSAQTNKQTQQAFQIDEDFSVQKLAENENYMNKVRGYMTDRYNDGVQEQDESDADYVERFITNMRSFENRSLELGGQIDYLRQADEGQRKQFLDAYNIYNKLPGFMSKGGGSALSAIGDYAYYNVVDPVNLAGLGVGSIVAKQLAKQGVKGLMKGLASYGTNFLAEGAIGAGFDVGLQKVEKEAGIRDEYDFGRTAKAGLLSGAGSVVLQGAGTGIAKGYNKYGSQLGLKRDLKGELVAAGVNPESSMATRLDQPVVDETSAAFDYQRGKDLLADIGDVADRDLLEPQVQVEVDRALTEVAKDLFDDPDIAVNRAKGEKVSDAMFRLFQNEGAIAKIDASVLSGALHKAGLNEEQFAQIFRTTISDAGKQLNALSQLSKKLRETGNLDFAANTRIKEYFDIKQSGVRGVWDTFVDGATYLDRNRRALLVSSVQTTIRNASTTVIRGSIDTAASVLDSFAWTGVRNIQRSSIRKQTENMTAEQLDAFVRSRYYAGAMQGKTVKGKQVANQDKLDAWKQVSEGKEITQDMVADFIAPKYDLSDAMNDGIGMYRNIADSKFNDDVIKLTIADNPKLLTQISRSLTDIGDGAIARPIQVLNHFNMLHDGIARKGIYSASIDKQLRRLTGKGIAETLANNGKIPPAVIQSAVREALEFTFADMPTGPVQNAFVKGVEGMPFIGTAVLTFPRFTVAALNFTGNYVVPGYLAKGAYKTIKGTRQALKRGAEDAEATLNLDKGTQELAKGMIGGVALGWAVAYRAANQDKRWYEYETNDKRNNDLRPFFPLAPYLLVADGIIKFANGTWTKRNASEFAEGLIGTRLAGSGLYVINTLYEGLQSESEGSVLNEASGALSNDISTQKASEIVGNFVGELTGGPISTNLISSFVRDAVRTFDTDEAVIRDTRQTTSNTSLGRMGEAFTNAATRNIPYMNQDKPPKQSPTRDGDMYYQSPITTTVTGIRSEQARNELEDEMIRLGIGTFDINRSSGNKQADYYVTEQMGKLAESGIVDLTSSTYQRMDDAGKRNFIKKQMSQVVRPIAKDMAMGDIYDKTAQSVTTKVKGGEERTFEYNAMDKSKWGAVSVADRKRINKDFIERYGNTVENLGAYRLGVADAPSRKGAFR